MEAEGEQFRRWVDDQARIADATLAGLPHQAALLARIGELTSQGLSDAKFTFAGDRLFHLRWAAGADVPVLVVRERLGDGPRVLLDPAVLAGPERSHLDWYVPSPDGRLVACGISQGGSEKGTLRVLDVDRCELLEEVLPGALHGAVGWLPDGSGFVHHRFPDPLPGTPPAERRRNGRTYLHRPGTRAEDDLLVLGRDHNPRVPMASTDRPFVMIPAGSVWVLAIVSHSALSGTLDELLSDCTFYVAPRTGLADPATCPWRRIAGPADGVTAYTVHGDTMFLVTHRGAPRSRVLALSLADPDLARATEVVPGGERAVVAVKVVGDQLLVHDTAGGLSRLRRVPLAGGEPEEVPLPVDGAMLEWAGHPARAEALLVLNSWTDAPRAYRYDAVRGTVQDAGLTQPSTVDFSDVAVSHVDVPARDGTLVPLHLVHRTGISLDHENPTILTGYGSYGRVVRGLYDPTLLAWYERGGVYAQAGLRGGGEYGREWHEAGRGPGKENTITDFIDCAEYLVAHGYTRPGRLAGDGISAGGIPTGGALVRRPDLWAAMVMRVPAVNLTRQEFSENGPINIPEFGTVTTADGLRDLLIIDAYLRVQDSTPYPAVLLTAGLNDPRVAVWQPAKMAARLQAATSSRRPVLLRVDAHAGHGHGSTRCQRDALAADVFAFLLQALAA
jgi:prolyl oligopeptidase